MKPETRNPRSERSPRSEGRTLCSVGEVSSKFQAWGLVLLSAFCFLLSALGVAGAASSDTNAPPSIPQSNFIHPRSPAEGKDPFFPKSMRPFVNPVAVRTNIPVEPVHLRLNGITGPPKRLAMINGKTFEAGEEAEVKSETGGRLRIKCIEIKDESVLIEVGGERQELSMRAKLH